MTQLHGRLGPHDAASFPRPPTGTCASPSRGGQRGRHRDVGRDGENARGDRNAICGKQFLRLVLEQHHAGAAFGRVDLDEMVQPLSGQGRAHYSALIAWMVVFGCGACVKGQSTATRQGGVIV